MKNKNQAKIEAERFASFVRFRHLYCWATEVLGYGGARLKELHRALPDSRPTSTVDDDLMTSAPSADQLRDLARTILADVGVVSDALEEAAKAADAWQTADAVWRLTDTKET